MALATGYTPTLSEEKRLLNSIHSCRKIHSEAIRTGLTGNNEFWRNHAIESIKSLRQLRGKVEVAAWLAFADENRIEAPDAEIALLQSRADAIRDGLCRAMDEDEFIAATEELAELTNKLQALGESMSDDDALGAYMDDASDARREARFGVGL